MSKVALIGLDGISWKTILSYDYDFKNILRLTAGGLRGICWCIPPYTPPSWISISTGVGARKHGVLGFSVPCWRRKHYNPLSSHDIRFPRLSEMLALKGLRSVIINHPFSHPVSGWYTRRQILVSDDISPKKFIYPKNFDKYLRYFQKGLEFKPNRQSDKWVSVLTENILSKIEGTWKLVDAVNPDFLWVMFKEPDTVMHYLQFVAAGLYNEQAANLFSTIDEFVEEIERRFDYVLIVSDHGFDVYIKRINVFGVLSKHGFDPPSSGMASIFSKLLSTSLSGIVTWSLLKSLHGLRAFYTFREFFRRFRAQAVDEGGRFNEILTDEIDGDDAFVIYFRSEETRTRALKVLAKYVGKLLEHIEPLSVDRIIALLLVPRKGLHFMNDFQLRGSTILKFAASRHSPAGVFILKGPGVKPGLKNIKNIDVAPTVLSLFGLPLAKHFDGQSIIDRLPSIEDYIVKWRLLRKISQLKSFSQ